MGTTRDLVKKVTVPREYFIVIIKRTISIHTGRYSVHETLFK